MVKALVASLLGQAVSGPSTPGEAQTWQQAAAFLSRRVQGSAIECDGRAPDMSSNAATIMKRELGKIEAYSKLISNRERVIKDITNPGPQNIEGKALTQSNLRRVDPKNKVFVENMISEVCCRLLGGVNKRSEGGAESKVWAEAAMFLHLRIQASADECPGRGPDMSSEAATEMRKVLVSISSPKQSIDPDSLEAVKKLMSNRARVVQDISNPGPQNIDGKELTQKHLTRVLDRFSVDAMISEVCRRLLGKEASWPSASEDWQVWTMAASYLAERIQGSPDEMPGRTPDMSSDAATAMRQVLGSIGQQ